jgi:hypothetical protein
MDKETIEVIKKWFEEYVNSFLEYGTEVESFVLRKIDHTYRVCENIVSIAKSLNLVTDDIYTAESLAVFHDIGRFEQFSKYNTFRDMIKDHALLGAKTLEGLEILDTLSSEERNVIINSVKYHNIYELSSDENPRVLLFSKLIRDADKLDLFELHVKEHELHKLTPNPISDFFPDTGQYSISILDDIIKKRNIKGSQVKTYDDVKLLELSWIFDVNFKYAFKKIEDEQYIERIIGVLPKNNDIETIYKVLNDYLELKLQETEMVL